VFAYFLKTPRHSTILPQKCRKGDEGDNCIHWCGVSQVKEDPKNLELWISFYPCDFRDDENLAPKLDVKVIMPQGWNPRMYLATLNKSIRKHSMIISLELIPIEGRSYAKVNKCS
jgi:hypothetical protein